MKRYPFTVLKKGICRKIINRPKEPINYEFQYVVIIKKTTPKKKKPALENKYGFY